MVVKAKAPAIRFKGFTEDWEQRKLGDLMEISSASRVHKNEWEDAGVPFFRSSDVVAEFKGTDNPKAFISYGLYEELVKKSGRVQKDDVLVTGGGSVGVPYLVKNNEPLYFKDADLIWLKNSGCVNGEFLFTFFTSANFRHYVNSIAHIGTISHYTIEQAQSTPIYLPNKDEQNMIGQFFKHLDNLITLHQRKLLKLKNVKTAMLEKMFPKNGSNVPEIRFAGFTDAWEQRKAIDIFRTTADKNHPDLPVLSATQEYGMILREDTGINISHDTENEATYKRVWPGQFVIHLRSFQGGFAHANVDGITSPAYTVMDFIEPKTHYDFFWKYIFSSGKFIKSLEKVTYGIRDGRSISYDDFSTMSFLYSGFGEQKAIGQLFQRLDHLITLHQRKPFLQKRR